MFFFSISTRFSIRFEKTHMLTRVFFSGFVQSCFFMMIYAFELNISIKCFCASFGILGIDG
jgi:hypothetical protein